MTKKRFAEILKEYEYSDRQIEFLWESRPSDDLDEQQVREKAEHTAPFAKINEICEAYAH